jgi:hypothetical protein
MNVWGGFWEDQAKSRGSRISYLCFSNGLILCSFLTNEHHVLRMPLFLFLFQVLSYHVAGLKDAIIPDILICRARGSVLSLSLS